MVKHPCPIHPETLVHLQTAAAHAIACSRSPRLSQAHLQTHLSCAEAPLLRQRGCWAATLWASCVGIAFGCGCSQERECTRDMHASYTACLTCI
jgi:hypothetical protein